MPTVLCEPAPQTQPDYEALLADNRLQVAALFGRMEEVGIAEDNGTWSQQQLVRALRSWGLEEMPGSSGAWMRLQGRVGSQLTIQVDVLGPSFLPREDRGHKVAAALRDALSRYEVVYFNGHSFAGALGELGSALRENAGYRLVVLDSCWSSQHYALPMLRAGGAQLDLIVNDDKSVTGSVDGFVLLMRTLVAEARRPVRSWQGIVDDMNDAARARVQERLAMEPTTEYSTPEQYRLGALCSTQGNRLARLR